MSKTTEPADAPALSRDEAIKAYRACKTEAERSALYWQTPLLQEIFSAVNHPKPEAE
jgi:hypothetical protein